MYVSALIMQLRSTDFTGGSYIPAKFTCEGENVSPSFEIAGVPERTTCLVFIMDDPDAPGGTFTHWIMWNMSFRTRKFSSRHLPNSAIQGTNSAGSVGYIGPCPPSGTHRYFFRLYALDIPLDLEPTATVDKLTAAMTGHIVAQDELVGLYSKRNIA